MSCSCTLVPVMFANAGGMPPDGHGVSGQKERFTYPFVFTCSATQTSR